MRLFLGLALSAAFLMTTAVQPCHAGMIFSGTGTNPETSGHAVSGSADFTVTGHTLTVVLTNTSFTDAGRATTDQGDALTGIAFNLLGFSPPTTVLSLTSIALTSGSKIWTSKSASNTSNPLSGSWTNALGEDPLANYGVATTGFDGAFKGGSITRGNSSPDYGIVDGAFPASKFGGSQFPFIQNALTFTFTITGKLFADSDIGGVQFLFGTDGDGVVPGDGTAPAPPVTTVPEPATVISAVAAIAFLGLYRFRRRRTVDERLA